MKRLAHIAAVAIGFAGLSSVARADGAASFGVSLDGYFAPVWDDSVTNTTNVDEQRRSRGLLGLAALANVGPYAAGAIVDGFPGMFGNGRMSVGGVAGWQPRLGAIRWQVLGEIGAERFSDVGGTFFTSPNTNETWLDYVGLRLGSSETIGRGEHFELGTWIFMRRDLGQATVTSHPSGFFDDGSSTTYHLGGYTLGAAFRVGMRFDHKRASAPESREMAFDGRRNL